MGRKTYKIKRERKKDILMTERVRNKYYRKTVRFIIKREIVLFFSYPVRVNCMCYDQERLIENVVPISLSALGIIIWKKVTPRDVYVI